MNPFGFIADALHIWQVEVRAERWPRICCQHMPAVLVLHLIWVEIRQLPQILWKVLTMTAHALGTCLFLADRKGQHKSIGILVD